MARLLHRPEKSGPGKVVCTLGARVFTMFWFVFLLGVTVLSLFTNGENGMPILLACFSCFLLFLVIATRNYCITYDDGGFTVRNGIGKETAYRYDQITRYKKTPDADTLFMGKRRLEVSIATTGRKEFIAFVEEQYRLLHDGQELPSPQKSKRDIFKGNVEFTGAHVGNYILGGIVLLGLFGFSLWFTFFSQSNETNTLRHELCFSSCELSDGRLYLELPGQPLYRISPIDERVDVAAIAAKCDGQTPLTVYSKEFTPSNQEPWYDVRALFCDETPLFSFEENNRLQRQERWILVPFTGLLTLLWGLFIIFSIIVGRNPQKFSQKTWNFFFDNKYITSPFVRHRRKESKQ